MLELVTSSTKSGLQAQGLKSRSLDGERDTNEMTYEFVEEHEFEGKAAGTCIQGMVAATTEGIPPFGVMDKEEG